MSFFFLVAVRVICAAAFVVCAMREADGHVCLDPPPPVIRARVVLLCRERACESAIGRFFYRRVEREPRERCAPLLWLSLHLYSNSFAMPTMDTTQPNHTPHNKAKSKVHALNSLPQIISSPRTRSSLLAARIDVAALSPEHIDL